MPGGLLEESEDPLEAATRELIEETGYASNQWEAFGRFVPDSNYRCGQPHLFLARDAKKVSEADARDLEETEMILLPRAQMLQELNWVKLFRSAARP